MKSISVIFMVVVPLLAGCSLIRPNPVPPTPDLVGVNAQNAAWAGQVKRLPDGKRSFAPLVEAEQAVAAARSQPRVKDYDAKALEQAESALAKAQSGWQALVKNKADNKKLPTAQLSAVANDAHSALRLAEITRFTAMREINLNKLASVSRDLDARQQASRQRAASGSTELAGRQVIPGPLGDIEFKSGTPQLTAASRQIVKRLAELLREDPQYGIAILGHTDSTGPADASLKRFVRANPGLEEKVPKHSDQIKAFNLALSAARARAVAGLLVDQGISPKRIGARGFGDRRPVASNDTAKGRRANRRVEAVLVARPDDENAQQGG